MTSDLMSVLLLTHCTTQASDCEQSVVQHMMPAVCTLQSKIVLQGTGVLNVSLQLRVNDDRVTTHQYRDLRAERLVQAQMSQRFVQDLAHRGVAIPAMSLSATRLVSCMQIASRSRLPDCRWNGLKAGREPFRTLSILQRRFEVDPDKGFERQPKVVGQADP